MSLNIRTQVNSKSKLQLLLTVMRYEWRILKADRVFQYVLVLFVGIVVCALINGAAVFARQCKQAAEGRGEQSALHEKIRQEIAQSEKARIDKGEPLSQVKSGVPSASAVYLKLATFKATLPLDSIAILNAGENSLRPQTFNYKTGGRYVPFFPTGDKRSLGGLSPAPSTDNPMLMLLGQFDIAFVTLYIYPLIILVLSFNMLTADRDAGILALMLSQPIKLRTIILGKVMIRALIVFSIGVFLPVIVTCVIGTLAYPGGQSYRIFWQAGLWVLAALIYGCFWFALVLLINTAGRITAASGVISAACWILVVVLTPALINLSLQYFLLASSTFQFVTAERDASLQLNSQIDAASAELNQQIRERYPVTAGDRLAQERFDRAYFGEPVQMVNGSELMADFIKNRPAWSVAVTTDQKFRALSEIRQLRMEQQLAKVLAETEQRRQQRESAMKMLRVVSPTLLFQSALNETTGAGNDKYKSFLTQLDGYIRERERFFSQKILQRENIYATEVDHLPPFDYRAEPISEVMKRILTSLIAIVTATLGLLWLALRSLQRATLAR